MQILDSEIIPFPVKFLHAWKKFTTKAQRLKTLFYFNFVSWCLCGEIGYRLFGYGLVGLE